MSCRHDERAPDGRPTMARRANLANFRQLRAHKLALSARKRAAPMRSALAFAGTGALFLSLARLFSAKLRLRGRKSCQLQKLIGRPAGRPADSFLSLAAN